VGNTLNHEWLSVSAGISIERFALANQDDIWPRPDKPPFHGVAYGIPGGLYRNHAIGNAVVPQIPEIIGRAIMHQEWLNTLNRA
jgi:hypothetical protein